MFDLGIRLVLRAVFFGVSTSTAVRVAAAGRDHGDVHPKAQGRLPSTSGKLVPHMDFLLEFVRTNLDMTLMELVQVLRVSRNTEVHHSSVDRALKRAGRSYKNRSDRRRK